MPFRRSADRPSAPARAAALALALLAAHAAAQSVTGWLDVGHELASGRATVDATPWDIGSPEALFDGNAATLYRTPNISPAEITLSFTWVPSFTGFSFHVAGSNTRVDVAAADTQADLDAASGSFVQVLAPAVVPNEAPTTLPATSPSARYRARLTADRLFGDDYVHIREWGIQISLTPSLISVSPDTLTLDIGETRPLAAVAHGRSGQRLTGIDPVAWDVVAGTAVSVDASGVVTALAPGQATVRATAGGREGLATVTVRDDTPDLDVLWLERLPHYEYNAPKNAPAPGDAVTWRAHVRQWAGSVQDVAYRWLVDGQPVASGVIAGFGPSETRTVDLPLTHEAGRHTVAFEIDPANAIAEVTEENNAVEDFTDALIVGFWAEQSLVDYFHDHQLKLGDGANSWHDWAQRQIRWWNQLNAEAVWPISPDGVLDRFRLGRVVVVPDGALPLAGGLPTNNPDTRDRTVDLMWGFPSTHLDGSFYANHTSANDTNAFYLERSLLHELGHARYLVDNYGFDVHNSGASGGHDQVQITENGVPIAGTPLLPYVAFGTQLYANQHGGIMSGAYGFRWSPHEAAALNLIAGRRALCGNQNSPCNIGVYLNDLPERNVVRFVDAHGRPLTDASVEVYQAKPGPDWYGKTFDDIPDLAYTADCSGAVTLPRNPFTADGNPDTPDAPIAHTYGHANGVLIFRVEHASGLWYRFFELPELNLAYWAGHTEEATITIELPGAAGSPADFDADGNTDVNDLLAFLGAFRVQSPAADVDGDPGVTVNDLLAFLGAFRNAC